MSTPINRYRLKGKAKDFLCCAEKFTPYSVKIIHANQSIFDELLDAVLPSIRDSYRDEIPFYDKVIVPIK